MRVSITPDQVREIFGAVSDDPSFTESARLAAEGRMPAEMLQALALRPELLDAFGQLGRAFYPGGIVERDLKELVILEASRLNQCQFCTQSHIAMARGLGISDQPLALLNEPANMTERQRLALEYTRAAMADSNRVPDDLFAQLREHFTDPEIVEVTFLIGFINALNIFNNALRVTYHGDYERTAGG